MRVTKPCRQACGLQDTLLVLLLLLLYLVGAQEVILTDGRHCTGSVCGEACRSAVIPAGAANMCLSVNGTFSLTYSCHDDGRFVIMLWIADSSCSPATPVTSRMYSWSSGCFVIVGMQWYATCDEGTLTPTSLPAPPAAGDQADNAPVDGGKNDDTDLLIIVIVVLLVLLLTFCALMLLRSRRRRAITKEALRVASADLSERLRKLNDDVMRTVVNELQNSLPPVTPPEEVMHGGINGLVATDPDDDKRGGGGGGGSAGDPDAKLLHGMQLLLNESLAAMHGKAATAKRVLNSLGAAGNHPSCPLAVGLTTALDHACAADAVLNHAKKVAHATYEKIEERVRTSAFTLFDLPSPSHVDGDSAHPHSLEDEVEAGEQQMPSSSCCYRFMCICRSEEIELCVKLRRALLFDVCRMMAVGISYTDAAQEAANTATGENGDAGGASADTQRPANAAFAAILDDEMEMGASPSTDQSTVLLNSSGYVSRRLISVFVSCKEYITRVGASRVIVRGHSRMASLDETHRRLRLLFTRAAPPQQGPMPGRDQRMTGTTQMLPLPVNPDADVRYFSSGQLREDLYCYFKNMQICVAKSDSLEKTFFPMFDVIEYFDTQLKRWARDAAAVINKRVAHEWRKCTTTFLKFQAKLDLEAAKQCARSVAVADFAPSSWRPHQRDADDGIATGDDDPQLAFDEAHAEQLVNGCLKSFVAEVKAAFLSNREPYERRRGGTGGAITNDLPNLPAVRRLPTGEKATYDHLSSLVRASTVRDMMPAVFLNAARTELWTLRKNIVDFLYPPGGFCTRGHGADDCDAAAMELETEARDGGSVFTPREADELRPDGQPHSDNLSADVELLCDARQAAAGSPVGRPPSPPRRTGLGLVSEIELFARDAFEESCVQLDETISALVEETEYSFAERILLNNPAAADAAKRWMKLVRGVAEPRMRELATIVTALKSCHSHARTIAALRAELGGQYAAATRKNLADALKAQHQNLTQLAQYPRFAAFLPLDDIIAIHNHCAEIMGEPPFVEEGESGALTQGARATYSPSADRE